MLCPFQTLFPWRQLWGRSNRGNIPIWRMKHFRHKLVKWLHGTPQHGLRRLNSDLSDVVHQSTLPRSDMPVYSHSLPFICLQNIFKNIFLIATSQGGLLLMSHLTQVPIRSAQYDYFFLDIIIPQQPRAIYKYTVSSKTVYFTMSKHSSVTPALGCILLGSPTDAS